jgi:hypothetical protein
LVPEAGQFLVELIIKPSKAPRGSPVGEAP